MGSSLPEWVLGLIMPLPWRALEKRLLAARVLPPRRDRSSAPLQVQPEGLLTEKELDMGVARLLECTSGRRIGGAAL